MTNSIPIFVKMSGTGNTFLLLDLRDRGALESWKRSQAYKKPRSEIAQTLCLSQNGFSADGLLFIEKSPEPDDFKWDFFNADGSSAEMCGNAARCVALFCHSRGGVKREMTFKTLAGSIRAKVLDNGRVEVNMPSPSEMLINQVLTVGQQSIEFDAVNTGVPHAVIFSSESGGAKANETLSDIASLIRSHHQFKPQGTNVTFFCPLSASAIEAITFERGVEGFTKACGTGAIAAAWSFRKLHPEVRFVEVNMPGGKLEVEFRNICPILRGDVKFLAEIKLSEDFF
ncbi:MAG: diaminopimelate epimerase [Bdellovibrionales bacterium]|nr:diaminopimelate epimerase [Bdellovibrionales bacterium]